jgi:hypothetical protein
MTNGGTKHRGWRLLKPWALEEPWWLGRLANLSGAVLALAAVLTLMAVNFSLRADGPETTIEGIIEETQLCKHRECRGKRYLLYVQGYDGLIVLPFEGAFRTLEAAGQRPVRALVTGDLAREVFLGDEQLLHRAQADRYWSGKAAFWRVMTRALGLLGLTLWLITVGIRYLRSSKNAGY